MTDPRIEVLCSDPGHPVWQRLSEWAARQGARLVSSSSELTGGDLLFLVSCTEIIGPKVRDRYRATLVLHAADLPNGRGWSPHIWAILEGRSDVCVSLIEATEPVDSGAIWGQQWIHFEGHELYDEINDRVFAAELELMSRAVELEPSRREQVGEGWSYRRRTPEDSRLDPDRTIADQFDLLRVCDPDRFPAFVELRGHRYNVRITKAG